MLSEGFVASIGVPERPTGQNALKDAGILAYELRPVQAQQAVFKKSVAAPNCVVIGEKHVFAAQLDKAAVHVYSRLKANQEAIVPFPEQITCIALACSNRVLILGTAGGKIFLWEIGTGRQITTPASHIQGVTALAVSPDSNFLLSASKDSTVHVWSIPALLSFSSVDVQSLSPIRTFSSHRTEVSALAIGHSSSFSNFAVSAAKDNTCLIWNYHTNDVLRTYLLSSVPSCLSLDPADRYLYVGCEDGTLQQLNLYESQDSKFARESFHATHDALTAIQPAQQSIWRPTDTSHGPVCCIDVSFDGCNVLSGHQSGTILSWDAGRGGFGSNVLQVPLAGPVTNLNFLSPVGIYQSQQRSDGTAINAIVKPKFGAFDNPNGTVAENYSLRAELLTSPRKLHHSVLQQALIAPSFPTWLLDEGLNELSVWRQGGDECQANGEQTDRNDDFLAFEDKIDEKEQQVTLEERNLVLQAELEALRRVQKVNFQQLDKIKAENRALLDREQKRLKGQANGGHNKTILISDASDED